MPAEVASFAVAALTEELQVQPLLVQRSVAFDPAVLRSVTRTFESEPPAHGPLLTETPAAVDRTYAGPDGTTWFVPQAVVPSKSRTSATPAVFIDREPPATPGGPPGWVLRVTVDLRRHPAVPETAGPLPVGPLTVMLTARTLAGGPLHLSTVSELPVPDPSVLRRVEAVAAIDRDRIAAVLKEDDSAVLTVSGTVSYAVAVAAPAEPPGPTAPRTPIEVAASFDPTRFVALDGVRLASSRRIATSRAFPARTTIDTATIIPSAVSEMTVAGFDWRADRARLDRTRVRFPRRPAPAPTVPSGRTVEVALAGAGLPAYFPTSVPAYRPVYALVDSGFGVDPGSGWRLSEAGPWKDTGIPGRYYLLPTEYRLAYDVERQLPAVDVVLVERPVTPGAPPDYRVRVRFGLVPWFDAAAVAALRETISRVEGITFPEFVVGGDDGASFHTSDLLRDLGGGTVGSVAASPPVERPAAEAAGGGAVDGAAGTGASGLAPAPAAAGAGGNAVDTRGFEYVVEGTLEYYTLLTRLLAPSAGAAPGLDGTVRVTLRGAADAPAPQQRDIPVRLRLDRPATDLLTARLLPVPPATAWPAGWVPPLYAAVRSAAAGPLDVGGVRATLLVVDPDVRLPMDAIPAQAEPAAFSLGDPATPAPPPTADVPPPAPDYPGPALALAMAAATDGRTDTPQAAVTTLQDRLAALGHPVDGTGLLDGATLGAVAAVQQTAGLPVSGAVDAATWAALFPAAAPPPPTVAPDEVLVELTPTEPVDPRVIGALAVTYDGVTLRLDPATVLERVHQLAASGTLRSTLRVRSYQLQHPEHLPEALASLYALEVQIRRTGGEPVTVFLSRDEPEKSAQLGFTVADLLGGATPGAPAYDFRRRNQTATGTGPWSDWESLAGGELFVTPAP